MDSETIYRIDLSFDTNIPTSLQYIFGVADDIAQMCGDEHSQFPAKVVSDILCFFNDEIEKSESIIATKHIFTRVLHIGDYEHEVNKRVFCRFRNLTYNIAYVAVPEDEVIYRVIYASFSSAELRCDVRHLVPIATHAFLSHDNMFYNKLGYTDKMFDYLGYLRDLHKPEIPNIGPLLHMIIFDDIEGGKTDE